MSDLMGDEHDVIHSGHKKIVECKECRFFRENWMCTAWHQFSIPEWYCSRGEKK